MLELLIDKIPTEEKAEEYIRSIRETKGIICTKCGSSRHWFDVCNKSWKCKDCKKIQSLVSETVMHATQLPCLYWLKVIYCFAVTPDTMRIKIVKEEIEPDADDHRVWEMIQKIRSMISAYVDGNKQLFSKKKFAVEVKNRYPQFNKYYEDELKFKILIREKEDWEKFTTLLDICMASRPPFKHQKYNSKLRPAE